MLIWFRPLRRCAGVVLPALAIAGCASPSEPTTPRIDFEVRPAGAGSAVPSIAVTGRGTVEVMGSIQTPCESYDASGQVEHAGPLLTITVVGQATGACVMDVVSAIPYRATVAGVPRGQYTVRLVHRYADANWPMMTVLNQRIEIR